MGRAAQLKHCRQRQLDHAGHDRRVNPHRGGLTQPQLGRADIGLERKRSGRRVGGGGHFAHRGGQATSHDAVAGAAACGVSQPVVRGVTKAVKRVGR